jgi:hypothetical protein
MAGFSDLLSGATGALGFGGGLGSGGNGQGEAGNTATSTIQETIDTKTDVRSGSGARGAVTINTAFPGGRVSSSADMNPPDDVNSGRNLLIAGGIVAAMVFLIILKR